jgi:hypothetical protein
MTGPSTLIALPAKTLAKLGSVCGMLGSDFPGERANAAEAATKLLKAHGVTWRQLVEQAFAVPAKPAGKPRAKGKAAGKVDEPDWRAQVMRCALYAHRLSEWEQLFIQNMQAWTSPPSAKQLAVLTRLFAKVNLP